MVDRPFQTEPLIYVQEQTRMDKEVESREAIYSIGLDAGGSKTRACAGFYADTVEKEYVGPGANPSRIGFESSLEIFQNAIDQLWTKDLGEASVNLVMGVAGIEGAQMIPKMESALLSYLESKSPGSRHSCSCMTDIVLIGKIDLGQGGGLSIILGTGSSFYLQDKDGKHHQGGGWGYILGDEGSGYGISKRSLQHFMRMIDGKKEDDLLRAFLSKIEGESRSDIVNYVYQDKSNFHHLVRWLVEESQGGNSVATQIIREELEALLTRISQFITDRSIEFVPKIVLNGGLAKNPHIHDLLADRISDSPLSDCSVQLSEMEPAEGAWRLGLKGVD